jgi:ComF family protein
MQEIRAKLRAAAGLALDSVLPPRCIVSGQPVERQGQVAPDVWAGLDFIGEPFCVACGFPFDFEVDGEARCAACLALEPPYETARAALKYGETSRDIILGFKHADKTHAVTAFMPWLKRAGKEMLAEADMIAPVPLHYWRMISRRYNQSAIIAGALSKEMGKPVALDLLKRVRATPTQGHLNAKQRFRNVRRAFALSRKHDVKGKVIVLIDDVYTTGATVRECAKVLKKAGAGKVHVLTLARVVKEGVF